MVNLEHLDSFGSTAAEEDPVGDYFMQTDAVRRVAQGSVLLVLGRKGTGKTALTKHFTENQVYSRLMSLRRYPWEVHATRKDRGARETECYIASWRFVIAAQLASIACASARDRNSQAVRSLDQFFVHNYGQSCPALHEILRPKKLKLTNCSLEPQILGNKLGEIQLERSSNDLELGGELDVISDALLDSVRDIALSEDMPLLSLHFDELDRGLSSFDESLSEMMSGLILAAWEVKRQLARPRQIACPTIYLRTDIWNSLAFCDKNKISTGPMVELEWTASTLKQMLELRIASKLGPHTWEDITTHEPMPPHGAAAFSAQPKWTYMLSYTMMRPRDVIHFANHALNNAKTRCVTPSSITNIDMTAASKLFSMYLRNELDDEIKPHWPDWHNALQAIVSLQASTFHRADFEREYERRKGGSKMKTAGDALEALYRFSVIGYGLQRQGGAHRWIFNYSMPSQELDGAASYFSVHPGLTEYARLRDSMFPQYCTTTFA